MKISVLVYEEGCDMCALALELDIRGYGETASEAVEEMAEAIESQLSFAQSKFGSIEPALFDAEEKYWQMYRETGQ